jgi:murein DD-endopeptidase MepM/ murein hydrolase activator NlpD
MTQIDTATQAQLSAILNEMEADNQRYSAQMTAHIQHFTEVWLGMAVPPPARVLFCSPVTGKIETGANIYGGMWFDAVGYCALYTSASGQAYHTGADLNLPAWKDAGSPVYAAADGVIVYSGKVAGWQGEVVTIRHTLETGEYIWTRYAHIRDVPVVGMVRVDVKRGEQIGVIADYTPTGAPGDHLHFDVSHVDLGAHPGDWPGMDKARVLLQYVDPVKWLIERRV